MLPVLHLVFVVIALASTPPLLSCPQETSVYPTATLSQFKGRFVPPDGEELLPDLRVSFVVHQKGDETSERWDVPLGPDGRFILGLPEGTYEFKLQVEGFLFTLVGDVIISSEANHDAALTLFGSWC